MGVSITPPLPHPTSSVSIPATIKLMCITDRADNHQPLSIAARAPYRPDRQMILTVRTEQSTLQITNETLPRHSYCHRRRRQDQPGRASLVCSMRRYARTWATLRVCPYFAASMLRVVSIGSPVSLAVEQKPSKDNRNKKLYTSFTNSKSDSDLTTQKCSAQNGRVGLITCLSCTVIS